jgi:hypothetical protein
VVFFHLMASSSPSASCHIIANSGQYFPYIVL